jgi:1-deoxy-D-xylulose-5-phosphate reductoisomerase
VKRIAILGSTGSIGRSALAIVDAHPDRLQVVALAAGENVARMAQQVDRYRPRAIAMATPAALHALQQTIDPDTRGTIALASSGSQGLCDLVQQPDVDIVLCASSGTAALEAVLCAIAAGKQIALANKEVLVMAGHLVMEAARRHNTTVLPVDSEHNAIHQCLHQRAPRDVRRLILTASGGPFRTCSAERLATVTAADALSHPTWKMGRKITIDSATLMNKGLEVIEAHWLFDVPPAAIDVIVHPQSIVHYMVELRDGSVIAQLGVTDMRLPIQYAFSYPERWEAALPSLNLMDCARLEFEPPDLARFPCLRLAYRALEAGDGFPVVLNAANEVAVASFLEARLGFPGIAAAIEAALDAHAQAVPPGRGGPADVAEVRALDHWARAYTGDIIRGWTDRRINQPVIPA